MGKKKRPGRATADDLDIMWDAAQDGIAGPVVTAVEIIEPAAPSTACPHASRCSPAQV